MLTFPLCWTAVVVPPPLDPMSALATSHVHAVGEIVALPETSAVAPPLTKTR